MTAKVYYECIIEMTALVGLTAIAKHMGLLSLIGIKITKLSYNIKYLLMQCPFLKVPPVPFLQKSIVDSKSLTDVGKYSNTTRLTL